MKFAYSIFAVFLLTGCRSAEIVETKVLECRHVFDINSTGKIVVDRIVCKEHWDDEPPSSDAPGER